MLPILLAGGAVGGGRWRPLAIVVGLVASFAVFTLAGAWLLDLLGLPQDFLRNLAIGLLFLLAATLLVPKLGELVERPFLPLTRRRAGPNANGFVLGLSLGLVFVPCAGPVLAAMTAVAAAGQVGLEAILVTIAYAVGAALPMLLIAYGGQRLSGGVKALRTHAAATRRVAGALLGATALAIALGVDQRFTTALPGYTTTLQEKFERSSIAREELRRLRSGGEASAALVGTESSHAPEFAGISEWVNTPGGKPLSLERLRGKVVLVDFWTYSCINCIRTLPQLKAWDRTYRSDGLVIVGVHTPEFAFERVPSNVRGAVRRFGLRYPVAIDNGYKTWNAYQNEYWPAKYLIDRSGAIRYTHFGEGEYEETESTIRRLLGERVSRRQRTNVADRTPTEITTPELYLGYGRIDNFVGRIREDRLATYRFPGIPLRGSHFAYAGRWRVGLQKAVAGEGARLRLQFYANDVYIVLAGDGHVEALVDGRRVKTVRVSGLPRLYTVLSYPTLASGLLELRFSPGLEGYAFTFG